MNPKFLYALWGGLLALCAGLGFIPEPGGAWKGLMVLLAVSCFIPPFLLLRRARRGRDRRTLELLRNLSVASLLVTLVLLIANFMSVMASEALGTVLYYILVIVSSPMVCGQYWAVSLFLWAYLMIASMARVKKR